MFQSGTKLGPYEIQSAAGAGGMGEVYRALDTRLDRTVAIKVLTSALTSNPEVKARFEREARAISGLNHPHICTLYDVGRQDGTDFLVMEYIEGETLFWLIISEATHCTTRREREMRLIPVSRYSLSCSIARSILLCFCSD